MYHDLEAPCPQCGGQLAALGVTSYQLDKVRFLVICRDCGLRDMVSHAMLSAYSARFTSDRWPEPYLEVPVTSPPSDAALAEYHAPVRILGESLEDYLDHLFWSDAPAPSESEIEAAGYIDLAAEQLAHELRMVQ